MKKTILAVATVLLIFASCATSGVAYQEANHYFFRNDAPQRSPLKITSEAELDSCFGMAAVMGKNGQPTPIDFNKKFAIGVVLPITDTYTTLRPLSLKKENGKLVFTYEEKVGQKQSYSMQPMTLIIVDKKFQGDELEVRKVRK
jgi:hypothetical protein